MKTIYKANSGDISELYFQLENPDVCGISISPSIREDEIEFSAKEDKFIIGEQGFSFEDLFKDVDSSKKQLLLDVNRLLLPEANKELLEYINSILRRFSNLVICNSNLETLKAIKNEFPDVKTAVNFFDYIAYHYPTRYINKLDPYQFHQFLGDEGFGTDFELYNECKGIITKNCYDAYFHFIYERVKSDNKRVILDLEQFAKEIKSEYMHMGTYFLNWLSQYNEDIALSLIMCLHQKHNENIEVVASGEMVKTLGSLESK